MRVCGYRTVNLHCAIRTQFAYPSSQIKICQFFAQTQRELDELGVLCSPQVSEKLINRVPSANCLVRLWFARVYPALQLWSTHPHLFAAAQCYVTVLHYMSVLIVLHYMPVLTVLHYMSIPNLTQSSLCQQVTWLLLTKIVAHINTEDSFSFTKFQKVSK